MIIAREIKKQEIQAIETIETQAIETSHRNIPVQLSF
jgi:hypothetical protein